MTDERLLEYLRNNLEMGYSVEYLTEMLVQKGWEISEIKEAINIVRGNAPEEEPNNQPPVPPQETQAQKKPEKARRPLGVTIICILVLLDALLMLFAGVLMIFMGNLFGDMGMFLVENQNTFLLGNQTGMLLGLGEVGSLLGFLGPIFIVIAIVEFVGFFLMWKMKKIGWIIVVAAGIATMAIYVLSLGGIDYMMLIYAALTAVVIIYLLMKRKLFT